MCLKTRKEGKAMGEEMGRRKEGEGEGIVERDVFKGKERRGREGKGNRNKKREGELEGNAREEGRGRRMCVTARKEGR